MPRDNARERAEPRYSAFPRLWDATIDRNLANCTALARFCSIVHTARAWYRYPLTSSPKENMFLQLSSSARISQDAEVEWDLRIVSIQVSGGTVRNEERNFCILFFSPFSSTTRLLLNFTPLSKRVSVMAILSWLVPSSKLVELITFILVAPM